VPGKPKRLVVDASLAGRGSHETREVLRVILEETRHAAAFDPKLAEEWSDHETLFSYRWRASMRSRRRIVTLQDLSALPWEKRLKRLNLRPTQRAALEKDLHLIRAAVATDETILSRDRKALALFCQACTGLVDLGRIIWANPDRPEECVLDWLRAGAKPEESRQIRNASADSRALRRNRD
jgi:hypothetical protein